MRRLVRADASCCVLVVCGVEASVFFRKSDIRATVRRQVQTLRICRMVGIRVLKLLYEQPPFYTSTDDEQHC